jgi:hypothetical protein
MIKQRRKQCEYTRQKEDIQKYTDMNPIAQNPQATIKLHEPNIPIRLTIEKMSQHMN